MDKLVRAAEVLRAASTAPEGVEGDGNAAPAASKKERLAATAQLADAVFVKQHPDFLKMLSVSITGLLAACSDQDSDVRLAADEALNRVITRLQDSHLSRLQVELYKAIKRTDTPQRSVRAALAKFADLAHLVKPLKRRVFVKSLLGPLEKLIQIQDEGMQETLAASLSKITQALGLFIADLETQKLLAAFVDNMASSSPVIRRTAADCAIAICEGSCSPYHYLSLLLNTVFELVRRPSPEGDSTSALLGGLLTVRRTLISYQGALRTISPQRQLLDEKAASHLLAFLLDALDHSNHNVVTGSLEALQQLLKILKRDLIPWFREPGRCDRCVQRFGSTLMSTEKIRVSVKALTISCLSSVCQYEPSVIYALIRPYGRTLFSALQEHASHSDPLVRSNVFHLLGAVIKASLVERDFVFDSVPRPASSPPATPRAASVDAALDEEHPPITLAHLCDMLATAVHERTSTAARMACQGVRLCISSLLQSSSPEYGLSFLYRLLSISRREYWLVKTEILETIGEIDFVLVAHLESSEAGVRCADPALLPSAPAATPPPPFSSKPNLLAQRQSLELALFLLGDEDSRVRDAAATTLCNFVVSLYYPEDWEGLSPLAVMAERRVAFLTGRNSALLYTPSTPFSGAFDCYAHILRSNLSKIVQAIVNRLNSTLLRPVLIGCYHALHMLASPKTFPSSIRLGVARLPPIFSPDILPLVLDHLRVAWMSLDLSTHVNMLGLVADLCRDTPSSQFRNFTGHLLSHLMRLLNICVHIINGITPTPLATRRSGRSASNTASPAASHSSHSSPASASGSSSGGRLRSESIRSQDSVLASLTSAFSTPLGQLRLNSLSSSPGRSPATPNTPSAATSTPSASTPSASTPSASSSNPSTPTVSHLLPPPDSDDGRAGLPPNAPRGSFAHLPHYMRLFDTMTGAYKAGHISLNAETGSRFGDLIGTTLEVMAVLVEQDGQVFHSHAEELLSYMQVLVVLEPRAVLLCSHQLLTSLFGHKTAEDSISAGGTTLMSTLQPVPAVAAGLSSTAPSTTSSSTNLHTLANTLWSGPNTPNANPAVPAPPSSSSATGGATSAAAAAAAAEHSTASPLPAATLASSSRGPLPLRSTPGFYESCIVPTRMDWSTLYFLAAPPAPGLDSQSPSLSASRNSLTSEATTDTSASLYSASRRSGRERLDSNRSMRSDAAGSPIKPVVRRSAEVLDKEQMVSIIRLFEPLVIRAMNQYTVTSSVPLQQQVLALLCRLLMLRVNYSLLDGERLFLAAVFKQLELIENGHVRDAHDILPYIFQFLALLSHDHHKMSDAVSIPRIIQLADGLVASIHLSARQAMPAVSAIVHELFLSPTAKLPVRASKEMELGAQREVVIAMLMKLIKQPAVWDILADLLQTFRSDADRWKRFSRKIVDVMIPLLSHRDINIKTTKHLHALHQLMDEMAPIALRPLVLLLQCMVRAAAPSVALRVDSSDGHPDGHPGNLAADASRVPSPARPLASDQPGNVLAGSTAAAEGVAGLTSVTSPSAAASKAYLHRRWTSWVPAVAVFYRRIATYPESTIVSAVAQYLGGPAADTAGEDDAASDTGASAPNAPTPAMAERAFARFLLDLIQFMAHHCAAHAPQISDLAELVLAQILQTTYTLLQRCDPLTSGLYAAFQRLGEERLPHFTKLLRKVTRAAPMLTLLWYQILVVLRYTDMGLWCSTELLSDSPASSPTTQDSSSATTSTLHPLAHMSANDGVVQEGAFLLECELLASAAEARDSHSSSRPPSAATDSGPSANAAAGSRRASLSLVLGQHTHAAVGQQVCQRPEAWFELFVRLSGESPVRYLFFVLASQHSALSVQLVHRLQPVVRRLLGTLSMATRLQLLQLLRLAAPSLPLLLLLLETVGPGAPPVLVRLAEEVLVEKLDSVLVQSDMAALRIVFDQHFRPLADRLPRLRIVFEQLGLVLESSACMATTSIEEVMAESPEAWHFKFTARCCSRSLRAGRSLQGALGLLDHLPPQRVLEVMRGSDFDLELLEACLRPDADGRDSAAQAVATTLDVEVAMALGLAPQPAPSPLIPPTPDWADQLSGASAASPLLSQRDNVARCAVAVLYECLCFCTGQTAPGEPALSTSSSPLDLLTGEPEAGGGEAAPTGAQQPRLAREKVCRAWDGRMQVARALTRLLSRCASEVQLASDGLKSEDVSMRGLAERGVALVVDLLSHSAQAFDTLRPCDLLVVLECAATVLAHPATVRLLRDRKEQREFERLLAQLIEPLATVFRRTAGHTLAMDPQLPEEVDPDMVLPNEHGLQMRTLQSLALMVRHLQTDLRKTHLPALQQGLSQPLAQDVLPEHLRQSLRRAVQALARLSGASVNHFLLCTNPENALTSRSVVELLEDLHSKGGESELGLELLQDELLLQALVERVGVLGWDSQGTLQRLWATLMALAKFSLPGDPADYTPADRLELDRNRTHAIRGLTSLLRSFLRTPQPGQPANSSAQARRHRDIPFLHTRLGGSLLQARRILTADAHQAYADEAAAGVWSSWLFEASYAVNIEEVLEDLGGYYSQLSVQALRSAMQPRGRGSLLVAADWRELAEQRCNDLLGMVGPLLAAPASPLMLTTTILRELQHISNLFSTARQWEWLLEGTLDLAAKAGATLQDDVQQLQALLPVAAKALGVLGSEVRMAGAGAGAGAPVATAATAAPTADELLGGAPSRDSGAPPSSSEGSAPAGPNAVERFGDAVRKLVEEGLRAGKRSVSVRLVTIEAVLHLMDGEVTSIVQPLLPLLAELVLDTIDDGSGDFSGTSGAAGGSAAGASSAGRGDAAGGDSAEAACPPPIYAVMAGFGLGFALIEQFPSELEAMGTTPRLVEAAVVWARGTMSSSPNVHLAIVRGLDRLLLSAAGLGRREVEDICSLLTLPLPAGVLCLPMLRMLLTCMYSGRGEDQSMLAQGRGGMRRQVQGALTADVMTDTVSVTLMERVGVFFQLVREGSPQRLQLVERTLAVVLTTFFPRRQAMQIVMGDFCNSVAVAPVAARVFGAMRAMGEGEAVKEWVVMSIGSMLQQRQRLRAVKMLSALFLAASRNPVVASLLGMGLHNENLALGFEHALFWVSAMHFFLDEELSADLKLMFFRVLESVPETPFREVVALAIRLRDAVAASEEGPGGEDGGDAPAAANPAPAGPGIPVPRDGFY